MVRDATTSVAGYLSYVYMKSIVLERKRIYINVLSIHLRGGCVTTRHTDEGELRMQQTRIHKYFAVGGHILAVSDS